ncbi:MAG TPA: hypothetical protein VFY92_05450 [Hyphomicrobiaceae bacterium]|nr:hypothetical protein [Hyphomicrobiaceae bacterium]
MPVAHQSDPATRYEVSRSRRDNRIALICGDGRFYSEDVPDQIRHLGPWIGAGRGDLEQLKPAYRALLAEQGFVLIYRHPYEWEPEVVPGTKPPTGTNLGA